MRSFGILLFIVFSLSFGFSQDEIPNEMVISNNRLGIDLFKQITTKDSGSVLISPYCATSFLALMHPGANKPTQNAINNYLVRGYRWTPYFNRIDRLVTKGNEGINLYSRYAIWPNVKYGLNPDYRGRVMRSFNPRITSLDYSDLETSCKKINSWAEQTTKGMIKQVVLPKDFQSEPDGVFNNLLYFEGDWTKPFDDDSVNTNFTRLNGKTKELTFLKKKEHVYYKETKDYKLIDLPYGPDGRYGNDTYRLFSMYIILPKNNADFSRIQDTFCDPQFLQNLKFSRNLFQAQSKEVKIQFPKITLSSKYNLIDDLQKIVLGDKNKKFTFDKLLNQGGQPLTTQLSFIYHDVAIEINRKSTRAAAITTGSVSRGIYGGLTFNADRPFIYAIIHNPSGTVLFLGRYMGE